MLLRTPSSFLPVLPPVAESDSDPCTPVAGTNSAISFSKSGRVYRVNDRQGRLFTGAIGTAQRGNTGRRLDNQWIDVRFQDADQLVFTPATGPESIAIVAPKVTDLLRVRPESILPGLRLDPVGPGALKSSLLFSCFHSQRYRG